MHRLPTALAGLTLVVALSAPAWAAEGTASHHRRFSGRSDSGSQEQPYGDAPQHDDPAILF